jgi:peptidoglycan/LPS O-acetylase OafA/YrhL
LVLTGGWLMSRSPKGLLPQHFGWVFGGIATTTLIAYGLSFIVERPFLNRVPHQKNNRWLAAAHKSGKMNTNG